MARNCEIDLSIMEVMTKSGKETLFPRVNFFSKIPRIKQNCLDFVDDPLWFVGFSSPVQRDACN